MDKRYVVYRKDRSCSTSSKAEGGGVMIAISKHIPSYRHLGWESTAEDLWVSIDIKTNNLIKKVSICAVYLPPPVSFEHLSSFLENSTNVIEQSDQVIILGDFNLSHIGWSQKSESSPCSAMNYGSKLGLSLIDFMSVNNLSQFNNVNNVDGKILDLVLTDFNGLEVTESNNVLSKIDQKHPPLLVSLPQHSPHFLKPILRPRYNY
ncbi:hypothetical protein FEC35_19060, partial [Acinetobacter baumannii]